MTKHSLLLSAVVVSVIALQGCARNEPKPQRLGSIKDTHETSPARHTEHGSAEKHAAKKPVRKIQVASSQSPKPQAETKARGVQLVSPSYVPTPESLPAPKALPAPSDDGYGLARPTSPTKPAEKPAEQPKAKAAIKPPAADPKSPTTTPDAAPKPAAASREPSQPSTSAPTAPATAPDAPKTSASAPPPSAEPSKPKVELIPAPAQPSAVVVPAPPPNQKADELARLRATLDRADVLLKDGKVAEARAILLEGSNAGSLDLMTAHAATFDPVVLVSYPAAQKSADPARAIELYEKATQKGSAAAKERLAKLKTYLERSKR